MNLTFISGKYSLNNLTAATFSNVGASPIDTSTMSVSFLSLLANSHLLIPLAQCSFACSIVNHCGLICLEATITLI